MSSLHAPTSQALACLVMLLEAPFGEQYGDVVHGY